MNIFLLYISMRHCTAHQSIFNIALLEKISVFSHSDGTEICYILKSFFSPLFSCLPLKFLRENNSKL